MSGVIIAVDGPAASGKGTLAARLAAEFAVPHLDTGLLYRAVARRLADAGTETEPAAIEAASAIGPDDLARTDLRSPEMDRLTSRVSAWPGLRGALLARQRDFARAHGAVVDGRDIGTVIFPDADAKLFVTATADERARRRLIQRGAAPDQAAIEAERQAIEARDQADAARAASPLRQAADADLLDTTALDADAAFAQACLLLRARLHAPRPDGRRRP